MQTRTMVNGNIEINSGFFNAEMVGNEPDRTYTAEQVNDYLKGLVSDSGIYANVSTACQVVASTGMNVIVKAGRGKVGNNWFEIDKDITIPIPISDVILNRVDSIVVSRNLQTRKTNVTLKVGTLDTIPTPPTLTRDEYTYEICLANITINKNITAITQSMINDTRSNNKVCGWIVGLIDQIDTTTLFNQYQNAQDIFINERTKEFDTWFNTNKETIVSTNLYREYRAVYLTTIASEQTLTIPSSILYVHNTTDVLNIHVNGIRLASDEYSINASGTQITLNLPLHRVGTRVEFVNKKAVEGKLSEGVVLRVETLESKMNKLENVVYYATGDGDNIKLSNMVKNFLDGLGNYAGVIDTSQMYIRVVGKLGITNAEHIFDFNSSTVSNRRVVVNFASASIPSIIANGNVAVFSCVNRVKIINANIKATKQANATLYTMYGGSYDNCNVVVDGLSGGTFYGAYGCDNVSNSEIKAELTSTIYGTYSCKSVLYNTILLNQNTPTTSSVVSIKSNGKQLLMGNFVNKAVSIDSSVVQVGTIML